MDARAGVSPGDEEVADILRRARKPVLLIANKIDDPTHESLALDLHRLGLGDPIPISALHGHGSGDLLDLIVDRLPGTGRAEVPEEAIRVAILGRPNVGKSSLLNAILGRDRVIVSETPGTTRDAIDTIFRRGERTFVFVDTAGIRRKRRHRQGIEFYSELRAREAAERADVALVLIDTSEGIVDHDLAVADIARKAQDSTLVVLAKWDVTIVGIEDVRPELERRLRQRPPHVAVSSKTGRGVERLLDGIETLFDKHTARVPTALRSTQIPVPPDSGSAPGATATFAPRRDAAYWERQTQGFDFSAEDKLDSAKFNLVLWKGLMGDNKPYPASRNKRNLRLNRGQLLKQQ